MRARHRLFNGTLVAACLSASGSVFGSDPTALSAPENLRLVPLSASSFSMSADAVPHAASYAFEVLRLAEVSRTEERETFAAAPELSQGWTLAVVDNAAVSAYSGESSTMVDKETSEDRAALKIEAKDVGADVRVEVVSPGAPLGENISTWSYWCKRVANESTDAVQVFGLPAGSETWIALSEAQEVKTGAERRTATVDAALSIRRVMFVFTAVAGSCRNCALDSCCFAYGGHETRESVATATNATPTCTFSELPRARYASRVRALAATPAGEFQDSPWSAEQVIDLAAEHFRTVAPISVTGCRGAYDENFSGLSSVRQEAELARVSLDFWQLFKGAEPADRLFYTAGTNSTKGGVYCYSDADRSTNSYMIGTVASGTTDAALGLAFTNDTEFALAAPTLTFTSVQRNFKANPATYVLEWRVTDGDWSIGAEAGDWHPLAIPETAPFTAETADGRIEYRQDAIAVRPDFAAAGLPDASLQPGEVLVIRWRHEKRTNGPMMGLDDVRVDFQIPKKGFGIVFQ